MDNKKISHIDTTAVHFREGTVGKGKSDTYSFSVSSDVPALMPLPCLNYEMGYEVLSHDSSAVDLSQLFNGAPLLFEHTREAQIGVIDSAKLSGNKLRVTARFGAEAELRGIREDVDNKIRTKVSVGYSVQEYSPLVGELNGYPLVTAIRWTPIEVSVVSIPADQTVGFGRSAVIPEGNSTDANTYTKADAADPMETRMAKDKTDTAAVSTKDDDMDDDEDRSSTDDGVSTEVTGTSLEQSSDAINGADPAEAEPHKSARDADDEGDDAGDDDDDSEKSAKTKKSGRTALITTSDRNTEVAGILKLATDHQVPTTLTAQFIERGLSYDAVATEILKMKENETQNLTAHKPLELSAKERKEYSIREALKGLMTGKREGLAWEISDEMAKRKPYASEHSFYVPTTLSTPAGLRMAGGMQTRTDLTTTTQGGDKLVFTQPGSPMIIDYLRNRTKVLSLGAQVLSGLTAPLSFPRQKTTGGAYWNLEGAAQAVNNLSFDNVTATQKRLSNVQRFSRELLNVSSYDVEGTIIRDLAGAMAVAIDAAAISGSTGTPQGILNTSGIQSGSLGPSGSAATYAAVVNLAKLIEAQNGDVSTMGWLTTPGVKAQLLTTIKVPGQFSDVVWSDDDTIRGYRAVISNNVPSTLSKGANSGNLSALIFGDFSQLVFAEFGAMELIVDPYTLAPSAEFQVTSHMYVDVVIKHPQSFAYLNDVLAP